MKGIITILMAGFFCLQCFKVNAQIMATPYSSGMTYVTATPKKDLALLKSTKTIFVLPEYLADRAEDFTQALKKKWTLTDIEAVPYSEVSNLSGNYSWFEIYSVSGDRAFFGYRLVYYHEKKSHMQGSSEISYGHFFPDFRIFLNGSL
jgi:hypothetical protein